MKCIKPDAIALVPDDFPGFVPKLSVKEGDDVAAGDAVMYDKNCNDIKLVSPVAGKVATIVRGERRKIERVVIVPGLDGTSKTFDVSVAATSDGIRSLLMESGLWAMMRQRPYDVVPVVSEQPRDVFVTAFDSAPLAPSLMAGEIVTKANLEAGVAALAQLTSGHVYVAVRSDMSITDIKGAEMLRVGGPHPSGNVGVQIAAVAPINKGETVWTLDIVALAKIGALMLSGRVDGSVTVAVTGSEIKTPEYVTTIVGCAMSALLNGNVKSDGKHQRVISGNVLTGVSVGEDGFLRFPYRQVTVIPEGDDIDEFMGWANPGADKPSVKRTVLGHFLRGHKFSPDARLNGGRRAMILSGEYDKVLPMDILGEYLIKAIMARDIEQMERLGIYEVATEDFALPEYVDTSKLELQKIVREGLDFLRKE
ncbi:MAG: Na(+)-translocating NADH-quinone reductase subunit A, partial [Muribaculaceae bacterium]|nr:Na(+)-translocating NADH-quinone reductase subunit A [Muribaculaceae bacterium]